MKQLTNYIQFILLVLFIGMGVSSCSSDEMVKVEQAEVTFMVTLQNEVDVRAIGDGTRVNTLIVEVFDVQQEEITSLRQRISINKKSNIPVSLTLAKDQTYNFVFWACYHDDNGESIYDVDNLKEISMNTLNTTSTFEEIEKTDAFYAVIENYKVKGNVAQSVELVRPLAQINVGTTSTFTNTTLTVKDVPTVFYPFTGTVSEEQDLTWIFTSTSDEELEVGENRYTRLAMGYVFAPNKHPVLKTCTINDVSTEILVQANCRSNIISNGNSIE